MFKFMDKKKDGKLTKDEVPPPMWEGLTKAGAVKDGTVSKGDFEAAMKKFWEHFGPKAQPQGAPGGGPYAGRWGGPNRPNNPGFGAGHGTLVLAPNVDQIWEHLTKIGAVKDGVVTKESLTAAMKKRQEERQKQQPTGK
jgi:hypothetical protein